MQSIPIWIEFEVVVAKHSLKDLFNKPERNGVGAVKK